MTASQLSPWAGPPPRPQRTFAEKREIVTRRKAILEETQRMTALGYRKHETDWEIHRGVRYREVIVDAQISVDRKRVWTKLGEPDAPAERPSGVQLSPGKTKTNTKVKRP